MLVGDWLRSLRLGFMSHLSMPPRRRRIHPRSAGLRQTERLEDRAPPDASALAAMGGGAGRVR